MADALAGLKIIELGEMVSAPYAAKLMADLGAEVIKVERPAIGDPARRRGPFPGGQPHPDKSGLFLYLNTNKLGVTLDVARPRGRELLAGLLTQSDVFIHNVPIADLERLGLDYEHVRRINPKLVMTSVLPFGATGPRREWRAEDMNVWSAGGLSYLNGLDGRPDLSPLKSFGQQAGYQGGLHAATVTIAAMLAAMRDGEGEHIDVSVHETLAAMTELAYAFWPYIGMIASRVGFKPIQPLDVMECRDGWIYLCCVEEHQWKHFVELMGKPEWAGEQIFADRLLRAANWDALKVFLQEWVANQTVHELYREAQARRIPFAPVSTMADLLNSEHLQARGFFVEIAQPEAGTHKYAGAPAKYGRTPWRIYRPAPVLGQHNSEVLGGRLGLDRSALSQLEAEGTI